MKKGKVLTEEELEEKHQKAKENIALYEYSKGISVLKEVIKNATGKNHELLRAKSYGLIGFSYYNINKIEEAILFFEKSHQEYLSGNILDYQTLVQTQNSLGVLYKLRGERLKSMNILRASLDLSIKYGINNSTAYNNIGTLFQSFQKFDEAIRFYDLASKAEMELTEPNQEKISKFQANKAGALINTNQVDLAEIIIERIFYHLKKEKHDEYKISCFKGLAKIAFKRNQFEKAEKFLNQALEKANQMNFTMHHVDILLDLANIYKITDRFRQQEKILLEAVEVSKKMNKPFELKALESLLAYHEMNQNFEKAFKVLHLLMQCKENGKIRENGSKIFKAQEEFEAQLFEKFMEIEHTYSRQLELKNAELVQAFQQQKKVELRIEALRKQLQPGYIFNTLQDIQRQAMEGDSLKASDYVADLASLMRGVLRSSRQERVTLEEELKLIRLFVQLEQRRRAQNFTFEIVSAFNIDHEAICTPPFLLLAFVQRVFQTEGLGHMDKLVLYLRQTKEVYMHIQLESQVDEVRERAPHGSTFGQFTHFSDELLSYKDIEHVSVRAKEFQHSNGNHHYVLQLST